MKPTQVTELFANIKKTFVSFFSILMFVALGVGIYLGICWVSPALHHAADRVFDEGSFHDFQIQFLYGLTDDDLAKLEKVEGVTKVEGAYQSFQTATLNGKDATVKLLSIGNDIDALIVQEGELPAKPGEMAFHAASAKRLGVNVGDTITFEEDADTDASGTSSPSSSSGSSGASSTSTSSSPQSSSASSSASAASSTSTSSEPSSSEDPDGMKMLTARTFKVTAIVDSPEYLAASSKTYGISPTPSGQVDALAWVLPTVFDAAAFQDGHPIVNITCAELSGLDSYGSEYQAKSDEIESRITELGTTLAQARCDDLHGEAQKQIDDGQAQLDDAESQIAKGEKDIADGEKQLANGRAELNQKRAEGQAQLDSAYRLLIAGEAQKADGERRLAEASAIVDEGRRVIGAIDAAKGDAEAEIADAEQYKAQCDEDLAEGRITQEEYDARLDERGAQATGWLQPIAQQYGVDIPPIDHTNYSAALDAANMALDAMEDTPVVVEGQTITLREARARLADAENQLAAAESEYYAKVAELEDGWAEYYAGQQTLANAVAEAEQQLADGEKQLEDARKQLSDGKAKVAEMKPKLDDAKASLARMKAYSWTVMPRENNAGAAEITVFSDVTTNLSLSMAALFIIVGLLVSYSAVSRIVHEQVTQIGTKKALGLRSREITTSFLAYSAIAVLSGSIIGAIVGFIVVEGIIGHVLGGLFLFGDYPPYFGLPLFLIVTALELALVLGATYLACRGILKKHAVELLRGDEPPEAKTRFYEKWAMWEQLPLLTQTIVNNCVNDKRRVFSTVVGVAGCTALIVTAITLNNDVLKSYDRHYADVYGFNTITYVQGDSPNEINDMEKAIQDLGATTTQVTRVSYALEEPGGGLAAMQAIVPVDEDTFSNLYHVRPITGGEVDLSQDGAWVTHAYMEHFGAKVGDEITVTGSTGDVHKVKILGFYEFWLTYHEMVMGRDYYEREFGETAPNVVLADMDDAVVADAETALSRVEGFYSMSDDKAYQYENFATFSSVSSAVVAIYLALSALMAIVVLLNLNVMFIDEKKRELIVLMINGFSVKDAKRYIYNDTIVLTALGIICGLVLGCVMGSVTVGAIEPSTATLVKSVDWIAVAVGVIGSAVLATIMSVIALRRIPRFDLTDINKF